MIDALAPRDRLVLEASSVEGQVFHRDAIAAMMGDAELDGELRALARQELIEPQASTGGHGAVYAFRHLLIRDAAYEALAFKRRAGLHEAFADVKLHAVIIACFTTVVSSGRRS